MQDCLGLPNMGEQKLNGVFLTSLIRIFIFVSLRQAYESYFITKKVTFTCKLPFWSSLRSRNFNIREHWIRLGVPSSACRNISE